VAEPTRPMLHGVTPYLTVRGATDAIELYKRAFGAEELVRMPASETDSRLMHAHLKINDADVMLSDEFPDYGFGLPDGGPSGITLHLSVGDADEWYSRALEAGCTVLMEISDQFWGDRYGQVRDPFGHTWAFGSPIEQS
jgi:PhnB protein